jgi:hypothetical protein
MNKKLLPIAALLSAVLMLSSCLNSDDDDDYTYYDDAAVTAFSLGTVNRYLTTTSSKGVDSTYKTTFTGSNYPFYIDQSKRTIYNVDSLPIHSDASKIVFSISTKNGGNVAIKNVDSDTLNWHASTDSVDFSKPRDLYVYSNSGRVYRVYTVTVNVHKKDSLGFKWNTLTSNAPFEDLSSMRAVALGSDYYVLGTDGTATKVYKSTDAESWTLASSLSVDAYKSVQAKGGALYTISDGNLVSTTDGTEWTTVASASGMKQLIAASSSKLYAIGEDKIYSFDAQNKTFVEEAIDDAPKFLPEKNIFGACFFSKTNGKTDNIVVVGNRAESYNDTTAVVWGKVDEAADYSENQPWMYYSHSVGDKYQLPYNSDLHVVAYGDDLLAFGDGADVYRSQDKGITWKKDDVIYIPRLLTNNIRSEALAVAVDKDNYLLCVVGSYVYRGRVNYMGWAKK